MAKKFPQHAFVSSLGRHTLESLGKDLGFHKLVSMIKKSNGKLSTVEFAASAEAILSGRNLMKMGIKVGSGLVVSAIHNGMNSLTNNDSEEVPLAHVSNTIALGKIDAKYMTTHAHVGKSTSSRLKNMRSNVNIDYDEKVLHSSDKDYQGHEKRKNLTVQTGFNEKGFCFLMEDTYLTVTDYATMYNFQGKLNKIIEKNKNGKTNLYSCTYKTKNKFKFTNRFEAYNLFLKVHLVKIHDLNANVRNLVLGTTNNKFSKNFLGLKLQEDNQYSDPKVENKKNNITLDFKTSLDCNLTDSIYFKDRAKIVETWQRVLSPGSIWEFNMEHHLGKGLDLNRLADLQESCKEHPSGYVFVLEYFGDRRALIKRDLDEDIFGGYSPTKLQIDFATTFCYLYDVTKEETDQAIHYRKKKREEDFEENGEYNTLFTPDREGDFHIDINKIKIGNETKANVEWTLLFNQNVIPGATDNLMLQKVQTEFEKHGIDPESVTEDDVKFNLRKAPSKPDKEYEGTEGEYLDLQP